MTTDQEDHGTGAGNPGSGPQTGTGGWGQDTSSGVSPQEAAENINPGGSDAAPPSPGGEPDRRAESGDR